MRDQEEPQEVGSTRNIAKEKPYEIKCEHMVTQLLKELYFSCK